MADARTAHKGSRESMAAAAQLAGGLEKIGLALKSRSWRREGRAGLGPLQRQVLTLLRSKAGQVAQVSTIANELVVRLPTASEAVATLERKRLVKRQRTMRDGRVVTVTLTAKGMRACSSTTASPDRLSDAVAALSNPEQSSLLKTLTKVIRTLHENGEISMARMCVSCRYFRPNVHNDPDRPHHCEYINFPFGDHSLRLDCKEYDPASPAQARDAWTTFAGERAAVGGNV